MSTVSFEEASASPKDVAIKRLQRRFAYSPDLVPGIAHAFELGGGAGIAVFLWQQPGISQPAYLSQHVFCLGFISLLYSGLTTWAGLNRVSALMRLMSNASGLLIALIVSYSVFLAIVIGLDIGYMFADRWLLYLFAGSALCVLSVRTATVCILRMLARNRVIGRNLAVLGTDEQTKRFLVRIARDEPHFTRLIGVFSPGPTDLSWLSPDVPILGDIDVLLRAARDGHIDDIVVAMPWSADHKVIDTIERLKELPVNVYLASDLAGFDLDFRPDFGSFGRLPVFEVVRRPITGWAAVVKRGLDFFLALIALIILAPLFLIVAVAIRFDTPGPVFFMQTRLGFNNKPFKIYKFRSMHHNCGPARYVVQATRNDPRITRVGRIIRATSIDELPQLLNVLNGSMSLVGPRPHALSHNEEYGVQIRGYFARHKVRPGITGWAQVKGFRGETAQLDMMIKRVEHDVYYAENWSILFDMKILIMTGLVVLFQKTAY